MSSRAARGVHRALLVRVAVATVVIAAVFATITHFRGLNALERELLRLVDVSVRAFNQDVLDELSSPPLEAGVLQEALEGTRTEDRLELEGGYFVYSRALAPDGTLLAERIDRTFPNIEELLDTIAAGDAARGLQRDPESPGAMDVAFASVEGDPYIAARLPMFDASGAPVAVIEGMFAVSEETVSRMRAEGLRTVGYVVLVVLATVFAMYPVIAGLLGNLTQLTSRLLDSNIETMTALGGAIAKRDSDTDEHNFRVSVYSLRLAERLGLDDDTIRTLIKGSLLHDVGKIGIRDAVLLKPGKLDDDEYTVMKTHVDHGMDITSRASWLDDAQQVVGAHHEKFDGTGYPNGLKGEEIPLVARIFAVVDVFDAVSSKRPYKEPIPFERTMEILDEGSGSHFDPKIVDAFGEIARELYDEFANPREELDRPDHARSVLATATVHYFKDDLVAQMS